MRASGRVLHVRTCTNEVAQRGYNRAGGRRQHARRVLPAPAGPSADGWLEDAEPPVVSVLTTPADAPAPANGAWRSPTASEDSLLSLSDDAGLTLLSSGEPEEEDNPYGPGDG